VHGRRRYQRRIAKNGEEPRCLMRSSLDRQPTLPSIVFASNVRCTPESGHCLTELEWSADLRRLCDRAITADVTKCGDSPNPRRTDAEFLPLGESNVPNLPDGGDHTADDNSLTIPTFLPRGHPGCWVATAIHERGQA